ncbi:tripartite tricarboxylate transporter substrate-binding protein [Reyranella sp.]|uniref:tripartite tricarboxylate transporter substrate-binding protein n=1 Tax=Reyranella sp. TaxID=1929291 RepID=UPI003784AA73
MRRIAVLLFAMLSAWPAFAQEVYPSRAITLITPYAPGGGSDFLTRTLAEALKTRLNQTVVVQNVAGAGGAVGSMQAAKAKPDGYTLLLNHIGMSTIPLLYKKLNFDPLASYELIGLFAEAPMVILARKDFAPKDFGELVAYAKANREKLTMASSGMGSATHLCAMLFQEALGVPLTMVQYKGGAPAMVDVRAGQVDLLCDLPTTTSGQIRSGDVRAYVLTATKRMTSLPDVPTAAEVGMPGLNVGAWYGFYAPAGTPTPIIDVLNAALRDIVQDRTVSQQLEKIETWLLPLDQATPEAHRRKLSSQIELWRPIIEKAGIQAE